MADIHGTMTSDSVVNSRADADRAQFGQLNDNADTNISGELVEAFFHVNTDGTKLLVHPIYKEINKSTGAEVYYDSEWDNVYVRTSLYTAGKRIHIGDGDTYDEFTTDEYNMYVGGTNSFRITTSFVSVNDNTNDVDFKVKGSSVDDLLYVDAGNDRVGVNTSSPSQKFQVVQEDAGTTTIVYPAKISHFSTGTVADGFGVGIELDIEDESGIATVAGRIESLWNDVGAYVGSDADMVFKTFSTGANEAMRLTSNKDMRIQESLFIAEKAAANTDVAAYGQVWVKNDTPNTLWYTDDSGTDFMLAGSPIQFGDIAGGNYSEFESDGTLEFNGDATTWEDVNVDLSPLQSGGTAPGFATYGGVRLRSWATGEDVDGAFEIPHSYKLSSDATFHIHFLTNSTAPTGTDNVKWQLDYWIVDHAGSVSGGVTTLDTGDIAVTAALTRYDGNFTVNVSNATLGGQFGFKISRITAAGDAYTPEVGSLTAGLHYEKDTTGSRQITTK